MTNPTRLQPHDFGEKPAEYQLAALPQQIKDNTERVLSGKLDDNLPIIFNTLAKHSAELGCLRYVYTGASTDDVLDLFGRSALAATNMFRLLGDGKSSAVTFVWDDVKRTVPALPQIDMHNSAKISFGLNMALLSGRSEELGFLSNVKSEQYVHPQIIQHEFVLQNTQYLQLLFANREGARSLKNVLEDQLSEAYPKRDPDSSYMKARCKLFFALVDQGAEALRSLYDALLTRHKKLFDSERNSMRWSILGLLSNDGLAAALLARRKGHVIDTKSPYLPEELLAAAIERNRLA